ncbi:Protein kinase-like domain [Pseudocohnilembus persalinus]|uniref:non-specific serine/threonine protein kinase n=1 Tax=Pseudocohnilembus persalinus TaxID=266149 RepID=A0A0V0QN76_PSEPJ|nr:Protein kinase-like domain [Pseudocohnilembus persalinus]|eukprot:KRX03702.1 Protein kinase-like domain [Pseudocohnilembus persalinus]
MIVQNLEKIKRDKRYSIDFREISEIGKGGFAAVVKVQNTLDNQIYAVKKIKVRIKDIKQNLEKELAKILQEARNLAKMNHPNIIRYYNSWLEVEEKKQVNNRKRSPRIEELIYQEDQQSDNKLSLIESGVQFQGSGTFILEIEEEEQKMQIQKQKIQEEEEQIEENFFNGGDSDDDIFDCQEEEDEEEQSEQKNTDNNKKQKKNGKQSNDKNLISDQNQNIKKSGKNSVLLQNGHSQQNILQFKQSTSCEGKFQKDRKQEEIKQQAEEKEQLNNYQAIILYIQTELCRESLDDYIQKRNKVCDKMNNSKEILQKYQQEAVKIINQVLKGVEHIHNKWMLVHRDLKPHNIFLTDDLQVKIGDFGLVKRLNNFVNYPRTFMAKKTSIDFYELKKEEDDEKVAKKQKMKHLQMKGANNNSSQISGQNQQSQVRKSNYLYWPDQDEEDLDEFTKNCGTATYASPEQSEGDINCDFRADIYSLGVVILQLFHICPTLMELSQIIKKCKKGILPENFQPQKIGQIVIRCLNRDPKKRPTLQEIYKAVNEANLESELKHNFIEAWIKFEYDKKFELKKLQLINKSIYIFDDNKKKASKVYNLKECNIYLNKDGLESENIRRKQKYYSKYNRNQNSDDSFEIFENYVIQEYDEFEKNYLNEQNSQNNSRNQTNSDSIPKQLDVNGPNINNKNDKKILNNSNSNSKNQTICKFSDKSIQKNHLFKTMESHSKSLLNKKNNSENPQNIISGVKISKSSSSKIQSEYDKNEENDSYKNNNLIKKEQNNIQQSNDNCLLLTNKQITNQKDCTQQENCQFNCKNFNTPLKQKDSQQENCKNQEIDYNNNNNKLNQNGKEENDNIKCYVQISHNILESFELKVKVVNQQELMKKSQLETEFNGQKQTDYDKLNKLFYEQLLQQQKHKFSE